MPKIDSKKLNSQLPDDGVSLFTFSKDDAAQILSLKLPSESKKKVDPFGKKNIHNESEDLSSATLETPNLNEWKKVNVKKRAITDEFDCAIEKLAKIFEEDEEFENNSSFSQGATFFSPSDEVTKAQLNSRIALTV